METNSAPSRPSLISNLAAFTAAFSLAFPIAAQADEGKLNRHAATDAIAEVIAGNTAKLQKIAVIDHSRLAEKEGVQMPSSVLTVYCEPAVAVALMKENPRVGLDLPQKILVFEEGGKVRVAAPQASFLAARHGITDQAALRHYQESIDLGLRNIGAGSIDPVTDEGVGLNFGINELVSDFNYADTIKRLKEDVMKQGDTVWFGDIDFRSAAAESGVDLPRSTLMLFGGPKPGGVAMAKFPKLGLDAFCQKLLVYEDDEGKVRVIFNDIVKMAELHYGKSAKPHEVINGRLTTTFEGATKRQ